MSPAQLAILGLLAEQPRHGYGIEQLIEQRGMRNWTPIGFSSIYHLLDELVAAGLATAHLEPAPGRGKQRKVHSMTPKGRRVWESETLAALRDTRRDPSDFLIALSVLPLLDSAEVTAALAARLAAIDAGLRDLERDRGAVEPVPDHVGAMFDFTCTRVLAERDWLREFVAVRRETLSKEER
jgi:DNA-binding PadR family transcriptional regulator